jgi:hypothetical protein
MAYINLTLKPNPLALLGELPIEFPPILAFGIRLCAKNYPWSARARAQQHSYPPGKGNQQSLSRSLSQRGY